MDIRDYWSMASRTQGDIRQQAFPGWLSPCMRVIEQRSEPIVPKKQTKRYEVEPVDNGDRTLYYIYQVWRDDQGNILDKIQGPRGYYAKHRADEAAAHLNGTNQEVKPLSSEEQREMGECGL